jgi:hypothetical protein
MKDWSFGIWPRWVDDWGLYETRHYKQARLGRFTITFWKDIRTL